jgi:hypothetical protein
MKNIWIHLIKAPLQWCIGGNKVLQNNDRRDQLFCDIKYLGRRISSLEAVVFPGQRFPHRDAPGVLRPQSQRPGGE